MKCYSGWLVFFLLLVSCSGDSEVNEQLLTPRAQLAMRFTNELKNKYSFGALKLVVGYNSDNPSDKGNKFWESRYKEVSLAYDKFGLKPLKDWKIVRDTLFAENSDYMIPFESVLIPFASPARNDNDPVYLAIEFQDENEETIQQFLIVTRDRCDENGYYFQRAHMINRKQEYKLNS